MKKKAILILLLVAVFTKKTVAEKIYFSADSMTGKTGKDADDTTLSGNAYVKTDSMEIYADSIKLHGKDFRYISAQGNIKGANTESKLDFTCNRLSYDRETKIATLQETVSLTDSENDVKAHSEIIEYNQNIEIAIMQINVNITQKNNICTCAYAIYRKKELMLNMSGNAKVGQDEDTFRAQEISLNLNTQEITLDGKIKGSVQQAQSKQAESNSQQSKNTSEEIVSSQDVINDFNSEESAKKQTSDEETTENQTTEQNTSNKKKKKTKKK